ncbi:MAG: N-carbamoylputrescine amidase [Methanobacteriota archaeon]|nr:MAG: N-carbamoylputrescine amidase [Euryarchaeota archaeon]
MVEIVVAATQMACCPDQEKNVSRAEKLVREAADRGAQVILLQELFEFPYFCQDQKIEHLTLAEEARIHPTLERMSRLAEELSVVLPVSFFEKANQAFFNSVMVLDADGAFLGIYRKSHIPNDPGYWEKFCFSPGDTGFKVWETKYCRVGVGICWDQWFPEAARIMALKGAEVLMYPTAIGSEPAYDIDTADHWRRVMQGHAAANMIPVVASNRIGIEKGESSEITFYGTSFIAGPDGGIVAEAGREEETVIVAKFDLESIRDYRDSFHVFRDRRTDLYRPILTMDGETEAYNRKHSSD